MLISFFSILLVAGLVFLFIRMAAVFKTKPVDYTASPADFGLPYQRVRIPTENNLSLHGWWIAGNPGAGKPALILLHGWRRNAERMMPYIGKLHKDYNLLVFDARNHGKSDTDTFSSMPRFAADILAVTDFIEREYHGQYSGHIGIIGLSMGGAAAIYAASRDNRLRAVVTVGAFANPGEVMRLEYKKRHIPYFPMVWLVFEYFQYHMKARFNDFAPEKHIGKADATFLIVHGKEDLTAPFSHGERLHAAAPEGRAQLLAIEGAGHSDCHTFEVFWPAVERFLGEALKG